MRPEKQLLLDEIKDKIGGSKALFYAKYTNLHPNLASDLRTLLIKNGASMGVVRKRIFAKAAEAAGFSVDLDQLEGHIAIFFANVDPFHTTKVIYQFKQSNENILEILGGRFEGKPVTGQEVELISKLPSKDEMRSQLLAVLEAPMSQFLGTVDALLTSVIHCLNNKSESQS